MALGAGSYRRLIGVPSDLGWEIVRYDDEKLQLVSTDLGEIRREISRDRAPKPFEKRDTTSPPS